MRAGSALVVLIVGALLTAPAAGARSAAVPTETARGVVFEDLDGDGERDRREPGVPDVSVSNGVDVVRTDARGRYSLEVTDETIIFITKPAGYMVPVDDAQLPQFYYLHYPGGTPIETEFEAIGPTGPLPRSVDFPLFAVEESDRFDAVVFADPQTRNFNELEDFKADVVDELVGIDAAFGLTVGDIVNDPLDLFDEHNAIVADIGIPWWNLPGNHDINFDVPDDTYSTQTYKSVYGPTDYSTDYGRVHFVNMDNVQYFGEEEGGYRGYLTEQQLTWLANDLAHVPADRLIVIATHIPLRTEAIGADNINTVNLDELFEVLEGREHLYSVSGHDTSNSWQMYFEPGEVIEPPADVNTAVWEGDTAFHHQVLAEVRGGGWTTGPLDAERGVQAVEMADGNPNGYYIVEFDGVEYTPRFTPASLPASYQIRLTFEGGEGNHVLSDGTAVWVPSGPSGSGGIDPDPVFRLRDVGRRGAQQPAAVVANVFDGGPKHTVEVSWDGGPFEAMSYSPPRFGLTDGQEDRNLDPYIQTLREVLSPSEQPASPQPSSHLWRAEMPRDLGLGNHAVTVRSTDPYGQVSEATEFFDISLTGRRG